MSWAVSTVSTHDVDRIAYACPSPMSFTPPPTPPPKNNPVELLVPTPRRVVSHGHSQSESSTRPKTRRARRWSSLSDLHWEDVPTPRALPVKVSLALAELVQTEVGYVEHLYSLVHNYLARLPPVLSTTDLTALVRNAAALLDLHVRLVDDLSAGPSTRTYVCQVLESWAPDMATLYAEFCAGHDAAASILRRAHERDPHLWSAWERDRALHARGHVRRHSLDEAPGPASLALSFSDLLIMPVQRVCKYHLLVSALRGPPGQDPEEDVIMRAFDAMHFIASRVDEAQRIRQGEDRARAVLERMDPASGLDIGHLSTLGPCVLIGSLDVCYYRSSTPSKPPLASLSSYASSQTTLSLATPGPSPHTLPSTVPFPQAQTPTTPHPLANLQKPVKVRHLAAFLWPGRLVLCKINSRKGRYEPKHWFLLKQVSGPSIENDYLDGFGPGPDASPPYEEMALASDAYAVQQRLQTNQSSYLNMDPSFSRLHVDVSAGSIVFLHGIRIAFARHVFELGASCAEERDVWLNAIAGARVDVAGWEKEINGGDKGGAKVSRSRSAVATSAEEPAQQGGLELVRSRSEGGRSRSRSRPAETPRVQGLGLAERVENAFLRDRQGGPESTADASPVSVSSSLASASTISAGPGAGTGTVGSRVMRNGSAGRMPVRLSVISGPGGTFRGTLSAAAGAADGRRPDVADGRSWVTDGRTNRAADTVNGRALNVNSGANVARTNSSSTSGTRSYPPSPVALTQSLAQPSHPTPQPQPHLSLQTQLPSQLPTSLVVHRPSASVRDMVDRALADVVSWPCTEARLKGSRRGPLFASPEDMAGPKSASANGGGGGMMGKVRPRRTSSALVGRHKSLLDALPGDRGGKEKEKEKEKKKTRPSSEGVVIRPRGEGEGEANGQKTPLQRKRATIHGGTQAFPTMDPPSPAQEPERAGHAVQVVAPGGQAPHPNANGAISINRAVPIQAGGNANRNGFTGGASQGRNVGPISPPRSRTVSSSGSFADGMRELFSLRRTFSKSTENMALASASASAPASGPNPIYSIGAGLTNTLSDEGPTSQPRPKTKSISTPSLVTPDSELYALGAGITNANTVRRKPKTSTISRTPSKTGLFERSLAALTKRGKRTGGAPLSTLTFTPLSEKDLIEDDEMMRTQTARSRSNEWYQPVPACRGLPDRRMLGADLYTPPALRLQPSPVAEEGRFADFGDEVYDEERY